MLYPGRHLAHDEHCLNIQGTTLESCEAAGGIQTAVFIKIIKTLKL